MGQTMTLKDWERVIVEASRLGCRRLQFIGGEPTLYPDLEDLLAIADSSGFEAVELYTNGTHLTSALKNAIRAHRVSLAFSFYSISASVHDAVTLHQGSHARTVGSIRWAISENVPLRVSIVDVGLNTETIQETVHWLSSIGVSAIAVDRERRIGRAESRRESVSSLHELCGKCWNGKLCVTPDGSVFPCVFARDYPVGTIAGGLAAVVESECLAQTRTLLHDHFASRSTTSCNPQCGPDCGPAECDPQKNCGPLTCDPAGVVSPHHGFISGEQNVQRGS
jgi:MoaA/NifB/PqqE/SkfB family radical SAM enzyme